MDIIRTVRTNADLKSVWSRIKKKEKTNHAQGCRCGNEGHKDLERWYEHYTTYEYRPMGQDYPDDLLDRIEIEKEIDRLIALVSVSGGYCAKCQDLLTNWPEIMRAFEEHYEHPFCQSILEVVAAIRNGCRLCGLLLEILENHSGLDCFQKIEQRLRCLEKPLGISIFIFVYEDYYHLDVSFPGVHYWLGSPSINVTYSSVYGENLLLQASTQIELVKKWLDICLATHRPCNGRGEYRLPTRLLNVGKTPVRLELTEGWRDQPAYATLSHCWGKYEFVKLVEESVGSFMTEVPVEELTKTFRDAIKITRNLGLEYLWIDSLCIIQNSDLDWQEESATMSSVYRGSTINIAAAGALDGRDGCFLRSTAAAQTVSTGDDDGGAWKFTLSDLFRDFVTESPLAGRAWALQERILAPRTLYCTEREMFWGCRVQDCCETFPTKLPSHETNFVERYLEKGPICQNWPLIVRLYTRAKLTFPKDKLVAMAGIARAAREENGDQYLAGLWRQRIERELLWQLDRDVPRYQSKSDVAPSWSWASIENGEVDLNRSWYSADDRLVAHVQEARVALTTVDPCGPVSGGTLTITYSYMFPGRYDGKGSIQLEKCDIFLHMDCEMEKGVIIFLLPLVEESGRRIVRGLCLLPTNSRKGEYHRVGTFEESFLNCSNPTSRRLWKIMRKHGEKTAEAACAYTIGDLEHPIERYVIMIV